MFHQCCCSTRATVDDSDSCGKFSPAESNTRIWSLNHFRNGLLWAEQRLRSLSQEASESESALRNKASAEGEQCDERRPICGHCARRKERDSCRYRPSFASNGAAIARVHNSDTILWDDAWKDSNYELHEDWALDIPASFQQQSHDSEFEALSYFFTNCVNPPREIHTHMFVESVFPLYASSPPDSPLRLATLAVASACFDFYRTLTPHTDLPRKHWVKAVSATRNAILNPELARSDEVLAAIFLLDFYEGLIRRYVKLNSNAEIHQRAAMAVISARGLPDALSDSSKRLFSALRSKHVMLRFQTGRRITDFDKMRFDAHQWPISRLDPVIADMANLFADIADHGFDDYIGSYHRRCLQIVQQLRIWRRSTPKSWEPARIETENLHPSIVAAGTYDGLCDVYSTHTVAQMMNFWRTILLTALRLYYQLVPLAQRHDVEAEMQAHVDDICATVPFHLGNRCSYYLENQPVLFPSVPEWLIAETTYVDCVGSPTVPTEEDQFRNAMFKGAWFILTPLTTLLDFTRPPTTLGSSRLAPMRLRFGQLEWIESQCRRAHLITFVPWPYGKAPLGIRGSLSTAPTWGIQPITQGEEAGEL